MRMMVFFDLPTVTKTDKRAYTLFRRFLLNDGYDMIQFSIYGRILNGTDARKTYETTGFQPASRRVNSRAHGHRKAIRWHETSRRPSPFSRKKGQRQSNCTVLKAIFQNENPLQARPGAGFGGVKCSYPG